MLVLVTYDVETESPEGRRRLYKVAKACQGFGHRVQDSVFECLIDPAQYAELNAKLSGLINPDKDSLRFYFLGSNWRGKVEHLGLKKSFDPEAPMIV